MLHQKMFLYHLYLYAALYVLNVKAEIVAISSFALDSQKEPKLRIDVKVTPKGSRWSMMVFDIEGALAPVFTPMDDAGNLNLDVIPDYMKWLSRADHNISGILVGGTTGEAALLNLAERKQLLEAWIEAAKPVHVNVISQVGGAPIPDVIELAKFSQEIGADAIMTLPELYFKPKTVEQLVSYLELVAKAAPSLPLIFYHFPMMSGVEVNMKQLFSLASSRILNFKGVKADLNVAIEVADLLAADQRVFIANHHLAPSALMGHNSSIATLTNLFPNIVNSIVESVQMGQVESARKGQEELNRLVETIASHGDFVPAMKAAMTLLTAVEVGLPRQPLTPLTDQQISSLRAQLESRHRLFTY